MLEPSYLETMYLLTGVSGVDVIMIINSLNIGEWFAQYSKSIDSEIKVDELDNETNFFIQ